MLDRAASSWRQLALAALALFGLVIAPLVHAEVHAREAEAESELNGLVERLALHGGDFDDVFAQVWQRGHGRTPPQHSHGPAPASGQQHGAGTLQHFTLALNAATPALLAPAPVPQPEGFAVESPERVPPRVWRMPALSQGPPAA
jgi:hypothetical protein